jgi:hypothetical protein
MIVTDRQMLKVVYDTEAVNGERKFVFVECRKTGFGFDEARELFKHSGIKFFQLVGFIPVADGYLTDGTEVVITDKTEPAKKSKKAKESENE